MKEEGEEEEWEKLIDRKWDVFWKRYQEDYPVAYDLNKKISKKMKKMFEKISPFYGEERPGTIKINKNGEVYSHEPGFLMLGATGETILEETKKIDRKNMEKINKKLDEIKNDLEKTQKYLRYYIPDLEDLVECPFCFEFNNPNVPHCIKCGKEVTIEENNDREK